MPSGGVNFDTRAVKKARPFAILIMHTVNEELRKNAAQLLVPVISGSYIDITQKCVVKLNNH